MSSFHGITYTSTINKLTKMIGRPIHKDLEDTDDKVQVEFEVTLEDGYTCYIYSWKEYRELSDNTNIEFHIGARDQYQSRQVLNYLNNIYKF